MCAAAGLAIGTVGPRRGGALLGELYHVVIAASTVALAHPGVHGVGDRLEPPAGQAQD